LFPESFREPKLLDYLSAVRLNLPKNTLRWLAFVGCRWCYPLLAGFGSSDKQVSPFDPIGGSIKFRFSFPYHLNCLLSLT
jgi:hypothetical protein